MAAEGATSWQIVEMLNRADFLDGTVTEIPPEGMLAPDTYEVRRGMLVSQVLNQMFESQKRILAEEWQNRAPDLPFETPEAALTLASIIEKETSLAAGEVRGCSCICEPVKQRDEATNGLNRGIWVD